MYTLNPGSGRISLIFKQLRVFLYPEDRMGLRHRQDTEHALPQSGITEFASMALQFLDFDLSEDAHGTIGWDAMASPAPAHNAALLAEVAGLLERLHARHGPNGPLDEGHAWDCDLQVHSEDHSALAWGWQGCRVQWSLGPGLHERLTLSLGLTGGPEIAHTLEQETRHP